MLNKLPSQVFIAPVRMYYNGYRTPTGQQCDTYRRPTSTFEIGRASAEISRSKLYYLPLDNVLV